MWTFGYDSSWCGDFSVETDLNEVAGKLLEAIVAKVLISNRVSMLRPIDVCIESPAYTSYLRCPQLWWHCRGEGDWPFEHQHFVAIANYSVAYNGRKSR